MDGVCFKWCPYQQEAQGHQRHGTESTVKRTAVHSREAGMWRVDFGFCCSELIHQDLKSTLRIALGIMNNLASRQIHITEAQSTEGQLCFANACVCVSLCLHA